MKTILYFGGTYQEFVQFLREVNAIIHNESGVKGRIEGDICRVCDSVIRYLYIKRCEEKIKGLTADYVIGATTEQFQYLQKRNCNLKRLDMPQEVAYTILRDHLGVTQKKTETINYEHARKFMINVLYNCINVIIDNIHYVIITEDQMCALWEVQEQLERLNKNE